MVVEEARDGDGDEDARGHDDGEDHGAEDLDRVEDEELRPATVGCTGSGQLDGERERWHE